MRRILSMLMIPAVAVMFAAVVTAETAKNAPENVAIHACQAKKAPVAFPHKKHVDTAKIACDKCHHTQKGLAAGSDTNVPTCASCHLDPKDANAKAPSCKEMSPTKNSYHINCIGCHKEQKKGPTKCNECHTDKK